MSTFATKLQRRCLCVFRGLFPWCAIVLLLLVELLQIADYHTLLQSSPHMIVTGKRFIFHSNKLITYTKSSCTSRDQSEVLQSQINTYFWNQYIFLISTSI